MLVMRLDVLHWLDRLCVIAMHEHVCLHINFHDLCSKMSTLMTTKKTLLAACYRACGKCCQVMVTRPLFTRGILQQCFSCSHTPPARTPPAAHQHHHRPGRRGEVNCICSYTTVVPVTGTAYTGMHSLKSAKAPINLHPIHCTAINQEYPRPDWVGAPWSCHQLTIHKSHALSSCHAATTALTLFPTQHCSSQSQCHHQAHVTPSEHHSAAQPQHPLKTPSLPTALPVHSSSALPDLYSCQHQSALIQPNGWH
jgi:hypothetical protein